AITLAANQVASGLALSILGVGLSAFIGKPYESLTLPAVPALPLPLLSGIPVLGPALFDQQALVYASWLLFAAVAWFLFRRPPRPLALLWVSPVRGPAFFDQQVLVYASWLLFAAVAWFLYRSRTGLMLR